MILRFFAKFFGFLFVGLGILLIVSGLIFTGVDRNLDNFPLIVDEAVDEFFVQHETEFGEEYEPEGGSALKEEIKYEMVSNFENPLNQLNFEFWILYLLAIPFLLLGLFLIYIGFDKVILNSLRGIFLQIGITFLVLSFALWRFVNISIYDLLGFFNAPIEVQEGVMYFLAEALVDTVLMQPIKILLIPFLIIGIVGIVIFVVLLFVKKKKR